MSDTLDAALEALRREQFYGAMAEAERALRQQQGEWALYTAERGEWLNADLAPS